jgi:arylsulfatase A-like enzyme
MSKKPEAPPNILFLQTDQHRRDVLGCYGNPIVRTPNIDSLAARGIRFNNAFTVTGVCTPTRGAMLSGCYPHKTGMIHNPENPPAYGERLCEYSTAITPFSEMLLDAGYELHHIGKWHIGSWFGCKPSDYGFSGIFYPGYGYPREHEHYLGYLARNGVNGFHLETSRFGEEASPYFSEHDVPAEASVPGYLAAQTIDALTKLARKGGPFFLSCNFWGPHIPVNIPGEYLYMYDPDEMALPPSFRNITDHRPEIVLLTHKYFGGRTLTDEMARRIMAAYYGYTTLIDEQIGRILQALNELGLQENTLIVFCSDHGSTLGGHGLQDKGNNMYDDVYRIPMIICGPPVQGKSADVDSIVSHIDLAPTFIEAAGRQVPEHYDGCSLLPYLKGDLDYTIRREMVMEGFGHHVPFLQRAIHDLRFKYIYNAVSTDEFYDVQNDPYETLNLIDRVDRELLLSYQRKLQAWMEKNRDPLLLFYTRTIFTDPYAVGGRADAVSSQRYDVAMSFPRHQSRSQDQKND